MGKVNARKGVRHFRTGKGAFMSVFRHTVPAGAGILWIFTHCCGLAASADSIHFPPAGMPYGQAKHLMLEEGFRVARDPRRGLPQKPNLRHQEINCGGDQPVCHALFIRKRPEDGWQDYAIVLVKSDTLQVVTAHWSAPMDGLLPIPPPEASDVPQLKGFYFTARKQLRKLGFTPLRMQWPSKTCANEKGACGRLVVMPEATCSSDTAECTSFWLASNGRVLKVQTIGERLGGEIYYVNWSTRREQKMMQGGRE